MRSEITERSRWCEVLGLSVWGPLSDKDVSDAVRKSIRSCHPDKGGDPNGAGERLMKILDARDEARRFLRNAEALRSREYDLAEPMDWSPYPAS